VSGNPNYWEVEAEDCGLKVSLGKGREMRDERDER
jgi:hypothetical protein